MNRPHTPNRPVAGLRKITPQLLAEAHAVLTGMRDAIVDGLTDDERSSWRLVMATVEQARDTGGLLIAPSGKEVVPPPRTQRMCGCHVDCERCPSSGTFHQHKAGECPVHPDAPVTRVR